MTAVRLGSREFLAGPGWAKAQPRTGGAGVVCGGRGQASELPLKGSSSSITKKLVRNANVGTPP